MSDNSLWIKLTSDSMPEVGRRVVGLWKEQGMICYLTADGEWVDEFHRCYCYTAPEYYAYLPVEFNEEK